MLICHEVIQTKILAMLQQTQRQWAWGWNLATVLLFFVQGWLFESQLADIAKSRRPLMVDWLMVNGGIVKEPRQSHELLMSPPSSHLYFRIGVGHKGPGEREKLPPQGD